MKLPNADRALVPLEKLRDYSLNPSHPEGKHKARVFRAALGLTKTDAKRVRQMILEAILMNEAAEQLPSAHGRRFVVDFDSAGAQGQVKIRSTWIVRNDEDFPRLTSFFIP
ncbi:MAG: hypothetical protein LC800_02120 [Acidobacteria bacterium]|nr:hypothetical protein [Acidobacteriota bacterium]